MPTLREIEQPVQVVVEGRHVEVTVQSLLTHLGIQTVQVQDAGGKDELPLFLELLTQASGFADGVVALGVIRDADNDANGAFRSVSGAIRRTGLEQPRQAEVITATEPRVGVFILPGGGRTGMLESLCLDSVVGDPILQCVARFEACLDEIQVRPRNVWKTRAHLFLAPHHPGRDMPHAARANVWPWDHAAFRPIRTFLTTLAFGRTTNT